MPAPINLAQRRRAGDRTFRALNELEADVLDLKITLRQALDRAMLQGLARGRLLQRQIDLIAIEELANGEGSLESILEDL